MYGRLNFTRASMFNFERLDILWAWIWHPREKLWPFEFFRSSVVLFRAFRYIMALNHTPMSKVMAIWIGPQLSVFNFERLNILCAWIGHPSEKIGPFEFLENFHCSISSVSMIYHETISYAHVKSYGRLYWPRASMINFERVDMLCAWIGHLSETLWPFEFLKSIRFSICSVLIHHGP